MDYYPEHEEGATRAINRMIENCNRKLLLIKKYLGEFNFNIPQLVLSAHDNGYVYLKFHLTEDIKDYCSYILDQIRNIYFLRPGLATSYVLTYDKNCIFVHHCDFLTTFSYLRKIYDSSIHRADLPWEICEEPSIYINELVGDYKKILYEKIGLIQPLGNIVLDFIWS